MCHHMGEWRVLTYTLSCHRIDVCVCFVCLCVCERERNMGRGGWRGRVRWMEGNKEKKYKVLKGDDASGSITILTGFSTT